MNTKIKVGVLGYGLAGRYFHVPFIQESSQFELVAVATSRPYAAAQLPGVRITDADDILNADDIDLVIVATPHRLHVPQTLAALEHGKHVVVENRSRPAPMTSNTCNTPPNRRIVM